MDDDQWRADGTFRGMKGGDGKKKGGRQGSGPQFMRVIPKFLQKYHEPPPIQAKFAPPLMPDGDEEELDEVQKAAMDEYLENKIKGKESEQASNKHDIVDGYSADGDSTATKKKQLVAQPGKPNEPAVDKRSKKKRKRKEMVTLSNKKLLSFSMDDEEA